MLFTIEWLQSLFTQAKGNLDKTTKINEVFTDSRKKVQQGLFVPIVGENFDAHDFVEQAVENGASAVLWQKDKTLPELNEDIVVFFVEDTLKAFHQLAKAYRRKVNPTVIGITGSNGKTTTKDLMASVVSKKYKTHATVGNFNNHIGLPLTILSMPKETEVLVLEMGMNDFHEIDLLSNIALPDFAVITNIGESHIEYLGSRDGIKRAKLEIQNGLKEKGLLIVDGDEPLLSNEIKQAHVISCGQAKHNQIVIENIDVSQEETRFNLITENESISFHLPLLGKHHAYNAAFCFAVAKQLSLTNTEIQLGFSTLEVTGMRFELLEGLNGSTIINDAYNASPTSMKATIEVVKQMPGFKKKLLVLGDIFELGEYGEELHASVADVITEPIHVLFTYGEEAQYISSATKINNQNIVVKHFEHENDLIESIKKELDKDTIALFKASRGMQFEKIVEQLL